MADDILIYGKDRPKQDWNMRKFLKRVWTETEQEKYRFHMTEIPYIGHILTSEGVEPDPNKSLLAAPKIIQAMMLALQRYPFTVKWRPDKEQIIADLLSSDIRNYKQHEEPSAREHVFQLQQHTSRCRQIETIDPVRDCSMSNTLYVTIQKETEQEKFFQQLSGVKT